MKKAHVFKYSQVIKTDRMATIAQVSKHSSIDP
ncbi:MAG: Transposase [Rickettsia helvetica]|uniref:Transposase n=1 Tax=Rickettsia helvetica TaxID=35789 RepID=A0ABM9NDL7_RICHE